jgi:hypothetical protein
MVNLVDIFRGIFIEHFLYQSQAYALLHAIIQSHFYYLPQIKRIMKNSKK